jgi:predicted RND superfamily exporter protein
MSSTSHSDPRFHGKQRLLLRIEKFSRERYRLVFLTAILAVVVSSFLGSRLAMQSDVLELIPKGNPKVDTFRDALRDFGAIDYLLILLEAGPDQGPDELEDFADVLAEKLEANTAMVDVVEYRFLPDERFLDLFYRNALLFLPYDHIEEFKAKLTDESIARQINANRLSLSSPAAALAQGLIVNDPLGLMPFFVERLLGRRGGLHVDLSDGYYLSMDGKNLIMLVKPTEPSQNLDFNRKLLASVDSYVARTRDELGAEDGESSPSIAVRYGGNYAVALEENRLILDDARRNLVISLVAVSLLYWLCYRRFAALLYSSLPLMVGQAMTLALAFVFLGELNAASASFTALLMGLGTDFTIVMYARYIEERQAGRSLTHATELMVGETGLGVFTGVITSAGTFFSMCFSRFKGLDDLGFLIGGGILLCGVTILFLMPAMITWNEGVRRRKVDSVKKLHLQSFLLEHLISISARHRWPVLAVVAVLTGAGAWLGTQLEFDHSLNALRSDRSAALQVQNDITDRFGASLSYMMAISRGATLEQAVARAEQVEERLKPFVASGVIGSYDSILTYLPGADEQSRIIEAVGADREGAFDPVRIRTAFLRALDDNGFRTEPFEGYLQQMAAFLAPERPITLADLENQGLGRLVDRYVHRERGEVRIVTYLYPTSPEWKRVPPPGLEDQLSAGDDNIVVTGTNVVGVELKNIFYVDIYRAIAAGMVLVFLLLLVDFRSLKLSVIAMAQLVTGVIMMLGAMKLADVHLNYVNAFVATMILGVGIDYSIHLIHRMHLTRGAVEPGLLETGKAVVIAALTNMAGFGTLTLGNYPALKSFGFVALLGSITCLFTSLTLVPALMGRSGNADAGRTIGSEPTS